MENVGELFKEDVRKLGDVKQSVLNVVISNPGSATLQNAARLCIDQLDLAYLAMSGVRQALMFCGQEAAEQRIADAMANGTAVVAGAQPKEG